MIALVIVAVWGLLAVLIGLMLGDAIRLRDSSQRIRPCTCERCRGDQ